MADIVSVVIPVYNGERFLRQAIESVRQQTLLPAKVIVVDDGSSDASAAIAESFSEVQLVRLEHGGVSIARNAGIARATGDFIALLDADDYWMPRKLELQLAHALQDPAAGVIMSRQGYLFEGPVPPWFRGPTDGSSEPGYQPSNWFVASSAWDRVGVFQPGLTHSEDTDWLARASDLGVKVVMVDEMLVVHRIHDANASGSASEVKINLLRTLRDSVHRKRDVHT